MLVQLFGVSGTALRDWDKVVTLSSVERTPDSLCLSRLEI